MSDEQKLDKLQSMFGEIEEQLKEDSPIDAMIDIYRNLKNLSDGAADLQGSVSKSLKTTEIKIIDELEKLGIEKAERNGYTYSVNDNERFSVKADDRETYFEWLRQTGHGDMVKEVRSVHAGTTNAFFSKDFDGDLPEFVSVAKWTDLRVRQSNNKSK